MPDLVSGATLGEVAGRVAADAVILVTPPGNRHAQIADACAAGLAILAEKPLADSLADARRHVVAAARAGVPLMVGLNFRYLAVTQALKSLFADDRLGAPAFGRFTYERWRDGTQPRLNKYPLTMDQPMLWEQSVHHFDLMRMSTAAEARAHRGPDLQPALVDVSRRRQCRGAHHLRQWCRGHLSGHLGGQLGQSLGFNWRTDCARGIAVQADMFGSLSFALAHDAALTPVALPDTSPGIDDAADLLAAFVAHLLDGAPLPARAPTT